MIQELKLQDPTKPMDSAQMLSTQMQMSTINTNQEMIKAMQAMQTAYSQTALSNATGVIGKNIEDGNVGEDGITKAYTVRSIENVDGEIQVKAQQILYLEDRVILEDPTDATKNQIVNYNVNGEILDEDGNKTGKKIVLTAPGSPLVSDGKLTLLDENNEIVADHKYTLAGVSVPVYSDQLTTLPFSSITKIF
jgi:flagellar basal-body rod modification protein FlgD